MCWLENWNSDLVRGGNEFMLAYVKSQVVRPLQKSLSDDLFVSFMRISTGRCK